MFAASAIYKLKKITFVVHTTRILGYQWVVAIFLCVVECEGSGILRRAENQTMNMKWTWTVAGVCAVMTSSITDLIERVNFWMSIVAAVLVFNEFKTAALLVLGLRHCRTTLLQLWNMLPSFFVSVDDHPNDKKRIFTTMTSTPSRRKTKKKAKKKQ